MKIDRNALPHLWKSFLTGGTKVYQEIADAFKVDQPELWKLVKQQDEECFSAKTDHVVAYGTFIWMAVTSAYGPRKRVGQDLIDELRREEEALQASLEDESEYVINEALKERWREFPEPALGRHIEREFEEGSAGAVELNAANNAVAVRCLLVMIRALVRVGGV
jgi:hypothetical protein